MDEMGEKHFSVMGRFGLVVVGLYIKRRTFYWILGIWGWF